MFMLQLLQYTELLLYLFRKINIAEVTLTEAYEEALNMYFPSPAISEQELSLEWLFL